MDRDLQARQEARELLRRAQTAAEELAGFRQEQLDRIAKAVAEAVYEKAEYLAQLAVQETGFGNVKDKTRKNQFASRQVWEAVKDLKTVGVLNEDPREKLWEVGVPVGVIAGVTPSTNPTSTVAYKAVIALKAGNAIVFSPHPKALECTRAAAALAAEAAEKAGAPRGVIGCLSHPGLEGCRELITGKETRLILATGGPAMVKAAYSSGKPAIGVGAGNGPAYIHPSADIPGALERIFRSKTFDFGTVCASEQSILVEKTIEEQVIRRAREQGFYFPEPREAEALEKVLFRPDGSMDPGAVGRSAGHLARAAGFSVPPGTGVLAVREHEVGPHRPFSGEKLCPVLAFYTVENQKEALEKGLALLAHEGRGHTFGIHCREEGVIREFALRMPVSRFLVNTPAALGGIGMTTGLFPALTLGCGAVGGSSSGNNISPRELINIRRVAWGREETGETGPGSERTGEMGREELVEQVTRRILERLRREA